MSTDWSDLPEELSILILSKIFGKYMLQRCRLVCKAWNKAVLVSLSPYNSFPCLLTFHQNSTDLCRIKTKNSTLCKKFRYDTFFSMRISNKIDTAHNILCSKYGWLLMSRNTRNMSRKSRNTRNTCNRFDLFLYHPFDNEIIKVPQPDDFNYTMLSFFNPPTSSDCIIIGVKSREWTDDPKVRIGVLKLGEEEDEWNHYKSSSQEFWLSYCIPVLHRGLLYFMDVEGNVATFNLELELEEEKSSPSSFRFHSDCLSPAHLRSKIKQRFLIKVDGEDEAVFAVFIAYDEKKVYVYKLLEPDMKWQLVEDLGDKMLFLGQAGSFAKKAPIKSMANKIYLTKFYGESGVFYSMETKKYHSFDGNYESPTCYGLAETFAAWIR